MQTIDFINQKGYKIHRFPDGEVHLELDELNRKEEVEIKCRIRNAEELFIMMQLSDILNRQCIRASYLQIYYLMGMRCDRLFDINRPFTLGIVADVINSFNADVVYIYDGHSNRIIKEIKNLRNVFSTQFLFDNKKCAFVAPDEGAAKRNLSIKYDIIFSKHRDAATGTLTEFKIKKISNVDTIKDMDLLVIDDLCDGGGTFVGIAPKLREFKPKSLSLAVTHAVQLKGIRRVAAVYDKVYITDSYKDWNDSALPFNVEVFKFE